MKRYALQERINGMVKHTLEFDDFDDLVFAAARWFAINADEMKGAARSCLTMDVAIPQPSTKPQALD